MNYLCIDIGGTSIKYALFNREGEKVSEVFQTPTIKDETSNQILPTVLKLVEQFKDQIRGVAISSAGVVDANGNIAYAGYTIPGYTNTPIKEKVESTFGIPCTVENDVNCACLGEVWKGSAQNVSSAVMLTIGTGVAGAVPRIPEGAPHDYCSRRGDRLRLVHFRVAGVQQGLRFHCHRR